jgi:hypothetical protein
MNLDIPFTYIFTLAVYLLCIALFYLPNTESIGFGLFFIWNIVANTFLLRETPPFSYLVLGMGILLLIASFFCVMAMMKLHAVYVKKSEPIHHFPQRRRALDNYKIMYTVAQAVWLFLIAAFYLGPKTVEGDVSIFILLGGIVVFLFVWFMQFLFFVGRNETDIYPFIYSLEASLIVVLPLSIFNNLSFQQIILLVLTLGGIEMSYYLVYLSYWIYINSLHTIS